VTTFRVWAPDARSLAVRIDGSDRDLAPAPGGWWSLDVPGAGEGTDYAYVVDGGDPTPDPRSLWQPAGVHAGSRVYDHERFPWTDHLWRGSALPGAVLYELHIGTFTGEGTFDAAVERLDHLVELGVSAVEVMPVAAFPGEHGWGYDGVDLWAVHEPYGGPDGFKRLVDACHDKGLGVVLDVVYNHLGPSGNYLSRYGPYFTDKHHTPWGSAVNLDDAGSDEVRHFIVDNALMWLRDYHLDGLRLDAVHALADDRATHLLEALSVEVDALATALNRPLSLIAESDLNDPRVVRPREAGGYGLTAQWSDDFHHALHALLTGETQGYYGDFGSPAALAKTLTRVFLHDGTLSTFRGRHHGRPVDVDIVPGWRFLGYLQDHDQVGNRALGDRISAGISPGRLATGVALLLTSPFTPMLFMGEEWAASTPWQYFADHQEPELAESIRAGRRREFAEHGWSGDEVPDPQDVATVRRSTLEWEELGKEPHATVLAWYRALISLRRSRPELSDPRLDRVALTRDDGAGWLVVHRGGLRVVCNLSTDEIEVPLAGAVGEVLISWGDSARAVDGGLRLPAESAAVVELTASG